MVKWISCQYADDFAGIGTTGLGVKRLQMAMPVGSRPRVQHLWACDKLRSSKTLIHHTDPPTLWLDNVLGKDRNKLPALVRKSRTGSLDLYSFTGPCQGWSQAGDMAGDQDPRSRLALVGIATVQALKPKAFMSENVSTLATCSKFKRFFDYLIKQLKDCGYAVHWEVLSSRPYVPQIRRRLYIFGIKQVLLRTRTMNVPMFPDPPIGFSPSLASLIMPLPTQLWLPHPPIRKFDMYNNVINAYKAVSATINPFKKPVIIDAGSSPKYSSYRVDEAQTLTRTRASQAGGYWCSTKGGGLDPTEMAAIQGFEPSEFPWKEVYLSHSAAGSLLGNAQTLPLVTDCLCHLLFHSSQIDYDTFKHLKRTLKFQVPS